MKIKNKKGFTLTELLIVIAIIGILSTIVYTSTSASQSRARDAKRVQEIAAIQASLERYYNKFGSYPPSDGDGCGGWDVGNSTHTFMANLASYLGFALPFDSTKSDNCSGYFYFRYTAADSATYGCSGNKPFYVLGTTVENAATVASSPGWRCSGKNWQTERTWWVTGKFEE